MESEMEEGKNGISSAVSTVQQWSWVAVRQLQPEVEQTVQQHVSYDFVWIRRTGD